MHINIIFSMKKTLLTSALLLLPGFAFAQITLSPLQQFLAAINLLEATVIPILIAGALVAFFVGLVMYLFRGAKSPDQHGKDKAIMVWGLVALFVMVSVWGLVRLGQQAFGISGNETINTPIVPGVN
jgi:formate/nitrite transporter FocA (FNT family)